jgi:hypothetical protein
MLYGVTQKTPIRRTGRLPQPAGAPNGADENQDQLATNGSGGEVQHKERLHKTGYFRELLATNPDIDEGMKDCANRKRFVRCTVNREC